MANELLVWFDERDDGTLSACVSVRLMRNDAGQYVTEYSCTPLDVYRAIKDAYMHKVVDLDRVYDDLERERKQYHDEFGVDPEPYDLEPLESDARRLSAELRAMEEYLFTQFDHAEMGRQIIRDAHQNNHTGDDVPDELLKDVHEMVVHDLPVALQFLQAEGSDHSDHN